MTEKKTNGRLYELDSLRGLAALAVVLFHYTTRYEGLFGHSKSSYFDFPYGYLGVHIFFIISGFVIFMTLTRTKDVKNFAIKRAVRLYPAYIVAVPITFILVRLYGLEGRGVSIGDAIINLTMLQGYIPWVSHVDGAYWSLTVELTFYVIMGIIFYLGFLKRIVTFSLVWLLGSAGIMITSSLMDDKYINFIKYLSISEYSHLFIAGIMFYLIREKGKTEHHLIILLCLVYEYIFSVGYIDNIFITIFFLLFYLLINNKLRFLNIRPLVFLGTISFSFYLVHQNIGYIIINMLERYGFVNEIFLVIPIGISILLASILTFFVEKPIQKWFRNSSKTTTKTKKDGYNIPDTQTR